MSKMYRIDMGIYFMTMNSVQFAECKDFVKLFNVTEYEI